MNHDDIYIYIYISRLMKYYTLISGYRYIDLSKIVAADLNFIILDKDIFMFSIIYDIKIDIYDIRYFLPIINNYGLNKHGRNDNIYIYDL